uniref:site-specific DNA-methyltransferase (adenine-specific) n=1 Tax=mine drainage metagenome TaxID=410659 RepID=E6PHB2_9ZZZZ
MPNRELSHIEQLVESFEADILERGAPAFNEAETRIRFLDPFFRILGWDIGEAKTHRVKVEPKHTGGTPDYEFFNEAGKCVFICEAKRIADPRVAGEVFSREDVFQVKKYAYSFGVPIAVIFNFTEIRVYAVTAPPDLLSPSEFEIAKLRSSARDLPRRIALFQEYLSRDAVDQDRFVDLLSLPRSGAKSPITVELLQRLLRWRERLADGFLKENPSASDELIDGAAALMVDRLIFAKFLIDRQLEDDFLLAHHDRNDGIELIRERFEKLEAIYNGGIFASHDVDGLVWPKVAAKHVIDELSAPRFPFDFSALPVEILGDIYESFIGVRAKRKSNTKIKLELTENLKKEKGVYYTPRDTVAQMVRLALSERTSGLTYHKLLRIRIIDPACGSGSFLVACYRHLLATALDWWVGQPDSPAKRRAVHVFRGRQVLSVEAKKAILESCIYGVDRDRRALDIASLSLYLILVENDDRAGLLYFGTPLPTMIGTNLLAQNSLIDDPSIDRFCFAPVGRFKNAMEGGGFDVCIMNPPYVFGEHIPTEWQNYLGNRYTTMGRQADYYVAFLERCTTVFLKNRGVYSVIIPDAILARAQREPIRRALLEIAPPRYIGHVGQVFEKVDVSDLNKPKLSRKTTGVSAVVLVGQKTRLGETVDIVDLECRQQKIINSVNIADIRSDKWARFLIYLEPHEWDIVRRIERAPRVAYYIDCGIARGEETGKRGLPRLPSREAKLPLIPGEAIRPFFVGEERVCVTSLDKPRSMYEGVKILVRQTVIRLRPLI